MLQHQAPPPPPSAHPPLNIASHLIRNDAIRGSLRSLRSMHSAPRTPIPHVVISDLEHSTSFAQIQQQQQQQNNRPPSSVGFNRRRISTVALNNFVSRLRVFLPQKSNQFNPSSTSRTSSIRTATATAAARRPSPPAASAEAAAAASSTAPSASPRRTSTPTSTS